MRILGRLFALIGFIAFTGIASVATGIMYLWWKDRQWEKELNLTGLYKETLSTPAAGETAKATAPQKPAELKSTEDGAESAAPKETSEPVNTTEAAEATVAEAPTNEEAVAESPSAEAPKSTKPSASKTKAASKPKSSKSKRPKGSASSKGKSRAPSS